VREERRRARGRRGRRNRRPERRRRRCRQGLLGDRGLARRLGAAPDTFAGLAGAGDLVATVVADGSRNRRAGELLAQGVPAAEIGSVLGQTAEAVDSVPLLAALLREAQLSAPATLGLAALVEGSIEPERWTAAITQPTRRPRKARAA